MIDRTLTANSPCAEAHFLLFRLCRLLTRTWSLRFVFLCVRVSSRGRVGRASVGVTDATIAVVPVCRGLVYSAEWRSQSNPDIPRDRRSCEFRYRSRWVRTRQRCALVHSARARPRGGTLTRSRRPPRGSARAPHGPPPRAAMRARRLPRVRALSPRLWLARLSSLAVRALPAEGEAPRGVALDHEEADLVRADLVRVRFVFYLFFVIIQQPFELERPHIARYPPCPSKVIPAARAHWTQLARLFAAAPPPPSARV